MSLTNFTASLIGRAVILVIMYVELYVTDKLSSESDRTSSYTSDNVCSSESVCTTDKLHSESNRTSCDTSDNVCRAVCH